MIRDLESLREAWLRDRPQYEALVQYVKGRTKNLLSEIGLWCRVTGRAKELDSLLKKCLRDPDLKYSAMPDKAGIRVVTRFLENLSPVCKIIDDNFDVRKREDFSESLGAERIGYQGIHLDIVLREGDPRVDDFGGCLVEIQVRTLSQDLWCEMAHELNYKPDFEVPKSLNRRVNCLSALMETCDREFSQINREIMGLPDAKPLTVLAALEKQFYKVSARHYDRDLSVEVIRALLPLYSLEEIGLEAHFEAFYNRQRAKISHILQLYTETPTRSLFLFQPEALMIFDLLDRDPFSLRGTWERHFPPRELERLATAWGSPL